jgi:hypothetical protein
VHLVVDDMGNWGPGDNADHSGVQGDQQAQGGHAEWSS